MAKLIVPLLALAFFGCAAALLVVIAKWQEEKERRWDEISRAAGLENEIERMRAREQCTAKAMMWYSDELFKRITENVQMKDKLSALLCPMNNHVWQDGVCAKCGRVKDG